HALVSAGLLRDIGQATYEMHPLLTSYLRSVQTRNVPADALDSWSKPFVEVMAQLADDLAPRELHEQRLPFHLHGQNFHYALAQAERLQISFNIIGLTQALASFAENN